MRQGAAGRKTLATISTEVAAGIRDHIDDGDLSSAAQTLRDGLGAMMRVRATSAKGERQRYEEVPDHAIRITSARLLIEFGDGRAVQRIHQHNTSDDKPALSPREIFGRLAADGDQMMDILRAYVDVAKESQTKKVEQVIDLPTLEDVST